MAIRFGRPPEDSLRALGEISKLRPGVGGAVTAQVGAEAGAPPEQLFPHKAFRFFSDDILAGRREAGAHDVGWHYLIDAPSLNPSVAEVRDLAQGPVLSKLTEGPTVGTTISRLKDLLEEVTDSDLELTSLTIPELAVTSLWLRGTDPSQDRYVPIQTPSPVASDREYGSDEFWAAMEKLASEQVVVDDTPLRSDESEPDRSGGQTNEL